MAVPQGLWLTGTSGDYASVPDDAALDITGDLTLIADVGINEIPPSGTIMFVSKWTTAGNQRSYYLGANVDADGNMLLEFGWSDDGTNSHVAQSTVKIPVETNTFERIKVEAQLDVDDGASGHTVSFFYYDDSDVQVSLGDVVQDPGGAGTTSVFASTAPVNMGAGNGGTTNLWQGRIYAAQISDGTLQLDVDFTTQTLEDTSFTEDSTNGYTVTVNQAGTAPNTAEIREVTNFYGWRVPTSGSSTDIWGEPLNEAYGAAAGDLFESIDTVIGLLETQIDTLEAQIDNVSERTEAAEALFNRPRYAKVSMLGEFTLPWQATTLVEWDSEILDRTNWFTTSAPTRLTKSEVDPDAPGDGLHLVRASLRMPHHIGNSPDDSYQYIVRILKNGSPIASTSVPSMNDGATDGNIFTDFVGSGDVSVMVQTLTAVALDDYFEVDVYVDGLTGDPTDSVVRADSFDSWFEIVRLPSEATETIPPALLTGILWWYEARLDYNVTGVADEADIETLDDWTLNERDAPATDTDLADLEADTTGWNGQPVYEAAASDQGIYQQTSPPDEDHMSVLVLILPSTAATAQRFWFDTGQGANTWFRMRNDGSGGDADEVLLTIRAGGGNDSLRSSGGDLYDGNAHAVLCTYDGTTMRIYVDDMTTVNNAQAHGTGGAISSGKNRVDIMHTNQGSAFEGEWALHAAWDHDLDSDERTALAAFLLDKYGIS